MPSGVLGARSRSLELTMPLHERHRPVRSCKPLDLCMLGEFKSILNVDAEIPDRVLDLGMAEQDLDRSKVSGGGNAKSSIVPPLR